MEGIIVGFKRGPSGIDPTVALVKLLSPVDISKITDARIVARDQHGNTYIGKIIKRHGNNNVVRVRFKPNIPGQLIGTSVEVIAR